MNKMETQKFKKTYSIEQEQWFNNLSLNGNIINEVNFPTIIIHLSNINGEGVLFEFSIVWKQLEDETVMNLHMYDDSWIAFEKIPEFFVLLTNIRNQNLVPDIHEFAGMLDFLGFEDITERKKSET